LNVDVIELSALLQTILENVSAGIGYLNRDLRFCQSNAVLATMSQSSRELTGRAFHEIFSEIAVVVEPILRKVLTTGEAFINIEVSRPHTDGLDTSRFFQTSYYPVITAQRCVSGVVMVWVETTAQKEAEKALEVSQTRFRDMFEQTPFSTSIFSLDGRPIEGNPAAIKLWGFTQEFYENFMLKQYNILSDQQLVERGVMPLIQQAFAGEFVRLPPLSYDPVELGSGSQPRWVEAYLYPLRNRDGSMREIVLTHEDVTQRKYFEEENRNIREQLLKKELEATQALAATQLAETKAELLTDLQEKNFELMQAKMQLEEKNQKIEEASRLKSEFLANMSHELRTPLNAIIGFSELIYDGQVPQIEKQKTFIHNVLVSSRHLLSLINDVLDLSKIEAGKMDFRPQPIGLTSFIAECIDIFREVAMKRHIAIESHIVFNLEKVILDPEKLKQVLYNYLSNAIKFTPDGGRVVLRLTNESEQMFRIEVQDTGIGIDPYEHKRLFIEFQQLNLNINKQYPGTGLGLALTKKIVEAQGGNVGVKSKLGEGSTFFAVLPRVFSDVKADEQISLVPPMASEKFKDETSLIHDFMQLMQNETILIVDDNPMNVNLFCALFGEDHGCRICTAANAEQALQMIQLNRPRLIVMDLQLPGVDGLELTRRLRLNPDFHEIKIVAVTAYAMKGDAEKALAAGCNAYIPKPIDTRTFLATIVDLLMNKLF